MIKILLDSNFFLSFYRESNNQALKVLDNVEKYKDHIIITEQVYCEVQRNRIEEINSLIERLKNINRINIGLPAVIENYKEAKEINSKKKDINRNVNIIIKKLQNIIEDENTDSIFIKFNQLYSDTRVVNIPTNDKIIQKAHQRKLIGNPPKSDKKKTIGDEIIWESILDNGEYDIIIVSSDGTFRKNISFLKKEYNKVTGKKILLITEEVTEALKSIGEKQSQKLVDIEKEHVAMTTTAFNLASGSLATVFPINLRGEESGFSSGFSKGFGAGIPGTVVFMNETQFSSPAEFANFKKCPKCHNIGYWDNDNCPMCKEKP
jgi:hypothetical protein